MFDSADSQRPRQKQGVHPNNLARQVLDSLQEGCQVISPDYRYLYVNDAVLGHARATRQQLLGRTMPEVYPGIDRTPMFARLQRCMQERSAQQMENEFTFADGSRGWFELRFEPVPEGVCILSLDVTDRKRAENHAHRVNERLYQLTRVVRELASARELDQVTQIVRQAARQLAGADGATFVLRHGEHCHYVDEDAIAPLWKGKKFPLSDCISGWSMLHQQPVAIEDIYRDDRIPYEVYRPTFVKSLVMTPIRRDAPIGAIGVYWSTHHRATPEEERLLQALADSTSVALENLRAYRELAESEQQLRQSQKLEAVGRLAGGVAHDFNNLLTVINGYTEFAVTSLAEHDSIRADLLEVHRAGEHAADLTRQLLAFSRKQVLEPEILNLGEVIRGIDNLLRRLLGEDVVIDARTADDLGHVQADPAQLEQVIMNLALNARDAMPQGGRLTLETQNAELDERYAEQHLDVEPGPYVVLSVSDTGHGMDAETRDRIFEPFFTTKANQGTGLGLSTVYGIVKQSGGHIWVYSEPGQGTAFKVYLPRVDTPAPRRTRESPTRTATGHETVLIVEDEPAVRRITERILKAAGYHVLSAASGPEALSLCESHEAAAGIDLLLTDVVMPEMSGKQLAARLAETRPRLKVLYASGYADHTIAHQDILDPNTRFIGKPFSAFNLTRKVREVLDEPADSATRLG